MKLFEITGESVVYRQPVSGDLMVSDRAGGVYCLVGSVLVLNMFDTRICHVTVDYDGEIIDVIEAESILKRKRGKEPEYSYVAQDNSDVRLSDIDKEIVRQHMFLRGDEEVVLFRRKMPDRAYYIILYNGAASGVKYKAYDHVVPAPGCVNGVLYIYYGNTRTLTLLDRNLETIWEFQAPGEKAPISGANYRLFPYKDMIVANLSADYGEVGDDSDRNGRIFALTKDAGDIVWEKQYTYQVNDIVLLDEQRFFAVSCNQVLVLNPVNGELIQTIDTGLPLRDNQGRHLKVYLCLIVTEHYVLVYDTGDSGKFQFYDKKTLECVQQFDCHDYGFRVRGGIGRAYQLVGNKLFFDAARLDGTEVYLDNLFMIDLDNIHAPVELESGPDFDIHLPEEDNGCLELRVEGVAWQELVRFAERHIIRNLIFVGRGELNEVGNPFFKAVVKLIIKNCPSPRDVLEEKLKIMDDRLKWFFKDKYALHDEPITVEYAIE